MKSQQYKNGVDPFPREPAFSEDPFTLNGQDLNIDEMRTLLESSPAGIGIVKNRILGWSNDIFHSMFGYEPNSLKGKNTRILYADQKEYDRVGSVLYSSVDKYGNGLVETRMVRKDGSLFDCRIRASRLNKKDASKGIIVIVTDISELKMLQVQLQQAQKMEAIGVLAGGISHDFNNILMGIQGHVSLMQIDVTSADKVISHIKEISQLVKAAAELTNRLLGFARGGKYQISAVNVNELVSFALNIFRPTRKDIVIHETYEEKLHLVDADHGQLEQVLINLLINSAQAMVEEGDIFVETQNMEIKKDHDYPFKIKPGEYIKVTIRDTGIGMEMETQKKIFDPFFSTKELGEKKGRGLGLSSVFGIIKNHNGFILVDSEKGKGTSFHICLPASSQMWVEEEKFESKTIERVLRGSETVLLVDDSLEIINVARNLLNKMGYKPLVARNRIEAVEIFRHCKEEIALVVLDLGLPEMGGKQAFTEIKEIQEDAKILISTEEAIDDNIEGFLNQGCHGFIQKPFSLFEFSKALRTILDKS